MGRTEEARQILAKFEKDLQDGKRVEGNIAFLYLGLKDYDKTLDYMEKAAAYDKMHPYAERDPFLQELKDQPRFQALLKKAGLKQ